MSEETVNAVVGNPATPTVDAKAKDKDKDGKAAAAAAKVEGEKAPKAEKVKERIVVGSWVAGNFVPNAKQPTDQITDMTAMLAWARKNLPNGRFEFVKKMLGDGKGLTIAPVTKTSAKVG